VGDLGRSARRAGRCVGGHRAQESFPLTPRRERAGLSADTPVNSGTLRTLAASNG
jgi:hypothetical protein